MVTISEKALLPNAQLIAGQKIQATSVKIFLGEVETGTGVPMTELAQEF